MTYLNPITNSVDKQWEEQTFNEHHLYVHNVLPIFVFDEQRSDGTHVVDSFVYEVEPPTIVESLEDLRGLNCTAINTCYAPLTNSEAIKEVHKQMHDAVLQYGDHEQ